MANLTQTESIQAVIMHRNGTLNCGITDVYILLATLR